MYKKIRNIRLILSGAIFVALTVGMITGTLFVFQQMQLVQALLSVSAFWLTFWAVITLLFGRIYCSTVCPLGTILDIGSCAGMAVRRRRHERRFNAATAAEIGYHYSEPRRFIRAVVLMFIIVSAVVGIPTAILILDPYNIYSRALGIVPTVESGVSAAAIAIVSWLFIIFVAAIAVHRGRLLCNTICPVGTMLGCVSPYSLYNIDINTDKCVGCGACERVCRAECINSSSHTVDTSRCVVCFDCTSVCPNDAITFRRGKHRLSMPMLESITPTLKTDVTASDKQ